MAQVVVSSTVTIETASKEALNILDFGNGVAFQSVNGPSGSLVVVSRPNKDAEIYEENWERFAAQAEAAIEDQAEL